MKKMLRKHLENLGVFKGVHSPDLQNLKNCITGDVSPKMVEAISISELILFTSQFRRYIIDPNHVPGEDLSLIPINSISFLLAGSGSDKDRTVKAIRKALLPGYKIIDKYRKELAKEKAIATAMRNGDVNPTDFGTYKQYYNAPAALFTAMTNSSAYVDHLALIEKLSVGAGFTYAGELGSELASNGDMIPYIRILSETYDVGYKESKPLKDKGAQTPEIKNLAVSALFIGSQDNILYDEKVKDMFKVEMSTKLARRSFFTFTPEVIESPVYESVADMLRIEKELHRQAGEARKKLAAAVIKATEHNLAAVNTPIKLSEKAHEIYTVYLRYNKEVSEEISPLYPISQIVRKHMHWKSFKLAGAFALFNCRDEISAEDMIHAISFSEHISEDIKTFEKELVKEKYQIFSDYMRSRAEDGKSSINLHTLKQFGYITGNSGFPSKMKDLALQASSYDQLGIYTVKDTTISFEEIYKTDVTGASFVEVSGTKEQKSKACSTGFTYAETTFENLSNLLTMDLAFTPFKFKEGKRSKENVIPGTKWLCLDIDKSILTMEEMSFILQDVNHHIALTSNPDNKYKFRLIVELDAVVTLEGTSWRYFVKSVSEFLGIKSDDLPMSQIFFGYAGREVYSVTDKEPIEIKDHINYATLEASQRPVTKVLTSKEKKELLSNLYATFDFAFECPEGKGTRVLIAACNKAKDLGLSSDEIVALMEEINSYWTSPMERNRFENTILKFARKI
jgi:hypothetical protein